MIRFLDILNTPKALVAVFALVLVIDGFLILRHQHQLAEPATPSTMPAASPIKPAAPSLPSCYSASKVDFLGYSDALDEQHYGGTRVGGLSGLTYNPEQDVYHALPDGQRPAGSLDNTSTRLYTLSVPLEQGTLTDPVIVGATTLRDPQGAPFTEANFDGEGMAVTREGELLISSETEPSIRRFSLDGYFLGELPVAYKFQVAPKGYGVANGTFESLALSPNGRSLFTANEQPISSDGQSSSDEPQRVRLLRYEDRGSSQFEPSQEFFYLTEPGQSLSEIAALSESELLVLEREKRQIFRVSLNEFNEVSGEENLAASNASPLEKELLVDVDGDCPLPNGDKDSFGLLEGMSLGPELPDGRQTLLLVSDDGFSMSEKTRMIALGIRLR